MNAIQKRVVVFKHVQTILDRTNVHVEMATFLVVTNMHVTVIDGCFIPGFSIFWDYFCIFNRRELLEYWPYDAKILPQDGAWLYLLKFLSGTFHQADRKL